MAKLNVQMTGIRDLQRKLKREKSRMTKEIEKETDRTLVNIQRGAKKNSVVDTGLNRSQVTRERDGVDGRVDFHAHYAPYIEFGTGDLVSVPEELKDIAEQFRGRGVRKVNLPARPFLWPAFVEERPKHIARLEAILGKPRTI